GGVPFFSPDGQWIGFFAVGKMKKIPVRGGAAVELCECTGAFGGSWSEDDTIVFSGGLTNSLSRVSAAGGGKPEPLTTLAGQEYTSRSPQFLLEVKSVLFTASSNSTNFDEATVQVVSLKTGKAKTLVNGGYFGRYVPSNGQRGHILYVHQRTLF